MPKGEASSVRKATSIFRGKKKERSQSSKRAKLGLLEKHKDEVERARNFHAKEKRIAAGVMDMRNQTSLLRDAEGAHEGWRCGAEEAGQGPHHGRRQDSQKPGPRLRHDESYSRVRESASLLCPEEPRLGEPLRCACRKVKVTK